MAIGPAKTPVFTGRGVLRRASLCAVAALGVFWASVAAAGEAAHPLSGTVWTGAGDERQEADMMDAVSASDFVLVGEIHDNPRHHDIQADVLREMTASGRRPAVILEMVPHGLQPELDAFNTHEDPDVSALGTKLRWQERGWPDWAIYKPVVEAAADAGLPLVAGDLDREVIRAIGKGQDSAEKSGIVYPEPERARLRAELESAHCGLLPDAALSPMIDVQAARDRSLADAMVAAGGTGGAVLIAGRGHVRNDWGVPFVLRHIVPNKSVVSIGLVETNGGETGFRDYLDEDTDRMPFDFVVFTDRVDRGDVCAGLEKKMEKSGASPD